VQITLAAAVLAAAAGCAGYEVQFANTQYSSGRMGSPTNYNSLMDPASPVNIWNVN
jgi:Pyruvate/2-oxoacid:ferredoxin oxidoreductase gamma subunit